MSPKRKVPFEVIEIESSVSGGDAARESSSDVEVVRPREASSARDRIAPEGDLEREGLSIAGGVVVSSCSRSFLSSRLFLFSSARDEEYALLDQPRCLMHGLFSPFSLSQANVPTRDMPHPRPSCSLHAHAQGENTANALHCDNVSFSQIWLLSCFSTLTCLISHAVLLLRVRC
jgi:hypothetical protein